MRPRSLPTPRALAAVAGRCPFWCKCLLAILAAALLGPPLIRAYGLYWDYWLALPVVKGG
jgi:hypothetical protein